MTYEERQDLRDRLIELGFWGVDEEGNPTTNLMDALNLTRRVEARLSKRTFILAAFTDDHLPTREVRVFHEDRIYTLLNADSFPEAISLAALALPEFLRKHPECAADQ